MPDRRERHGAGHEEALARVRGIEDTVRSILTEAAAGGRTPGQVAADRAHLVLQHGRG